MLPPSLDSSPPMPASPLSPSAIILPVEVVTSLFSPYIVKELSLSTAIPFLASSLLLSAKIRCTFPAMLILSFTVTSPLTTYHLGAVLFASPRVVISPVTAVTSSVFRVTCSFLSLSQYFTTSSAKASTFIWVNTTANAIIQAITARTPPLNFFASLVFVCIFSSFGLKILYYYTYFNIIFKNNKYEKCHFA